MLPVVLTSGESSTRAVAEYWDENFLVRAGCCNSAFSWLTVSLCEAPEGLPALEGLPAMAVAGRMTRLELCRNQQLTIIQSSQRQSPRGGSA